MYGRTRRQNLRRPRPGRAGALPFVTLVLLALLLAVYGYRHWTAEPLSPVTGRARVADGDSIEIEGVRIRLQGVDAPELHQSCTDRAGEPWPCGRRATDQLRSHLAGRDLTCRPSGKDRYHRLLAVCTLADGADVNAWLVRQGWALADGRGGTYQAEQDQARSAGRGIWNGTFMPPADWRRQHPD